MLLQKKQVCETFRKTHLDSTRGLGQHVLGHIIHRKTSESFTSGIQWSNKNYQQKFQTQIKSQIPDT